MSESGDSYDPGPWKGFDWKSARKVYDPNVSGTSASASCDKGKKNTVNLCGSYANSTSGSKKETTTSLVDKVVPPELETDSPSPVIIVCDITSSMQDWPEKIFKKLPLVDGGLTKYLQAPSVCFMAIGDVYDNKMPLQVQPFTSGPDLVTRMNALKIEGGGGGSREESYDLAALYAINKIKTPKAAKPIMIFIGDEKFYPKVDADYAKKWCRVDLAEDMPVKDLMKDLQRKFAVYHIRKPYGDTTANVADAVNEEHHRQWSNYLGADHVAVLNVPERVVDIILGLVAIETGMADEFEQEITERQKPGQVKTVMESLTSMKKSVRLLPDICKSVPLIGAKGKKSAGL